MSPAGPQSRRPGGRALLLPLLFLLLASPQARQPVMWTALRRRIHGSAANAERPPAPAATALHGRSLARPLCPPNSPPSLPPLPQAARAAPTFGPTQYKQALGLNFLFYEAQRSGNLPETASTGKRVTWRNDSHLSDPVVGGWYGAWAHAQRGGLQFKLAGHARKCCSALLTCTGRLHHAQASHHASMLLRLTSEISLPIHHWPQMPEIT